MHEDHQLALNVRSEEESMQTKRTWLAAATCAALALGLSVVPGPAGAQDEATVVVVHGIPSVGAVDVCADGSLELLSDVSFGGVAPVEVPAGTYDITVNAADAGTCTGAVLISAPDTAVPAGANVSAVANLTGGTPNLAIYANDLSSVAAGSGRVGVYHAANAPTVDILVDGGPGIDDLAQGDVANADLPAGTYTFTVTSADGSVTAATLPDVPVAAGELLQVFAVGAFPDEGGENPFQVVTNTIALQQETPSTTAPSATTPPATVPPAVSPHLTG
jgi:hypothetical protein